MSEKAECGTCKWWASHGNEYGRCDAPLPPMSVMGSDVSFCRGASKRDYWCVLWRSAQGGKL